MKSLNSLLLSLGFVSWLAWAGAVAPPPERPISLSQLRQEIKKPCTFVHAWAAWCEPCVKELPELMPFLQSHRQVHPVIIDVTDLADREALSRGVLDSSHSSLQTYYRTTKGDEAFVKGVDKSWSGALPYSALYQHGKLRQRWIGPVPLGTLSAAIQQECPKGSK